MLVSTQPFEFEELLRVLELRLYSLFTHRPLRKSKSSNTERQGGRGCIISEKSFPDCQLSNETHKETEYSLSASSMLPAGKINCNIKASCPLHVSSLDIIPSGGNGSKLGYETDSKTLFMNLLLNGML